MTANAASETTSAPEIARKPLPAKNERGNRYRLFLDRIARLIIGLGGVTIIAVILAILVVLLLEVVPLFHSAKVRRLGSVTAPAMTLPVKLGVDEYREIAYLADTSGMRFLSLKDGTQISQRSVPSPHQEAISAVSDITQGKLAFATASGKLIFCEVKFETLYEEGARKIESDAVFSDPVDAEAGPAVYSLAYSETKDGPLTAAEVGAREIVVARITEQKALVGPSEFSHQSWRLSLPIAGEISAVVVDDRAEDLFVGTSDGQLTRVSLREGEPKVADSATVTINTRITALKFLLGNRTLIVGTARGDVSSWQVLPSAGDELRLQRIDDFNAHSNAVTVISPSSRDKGFLTGDEKGVIQLHYGTTGRTRLSANVPNDDLQSLCYAPRADGFVTLGSNGEINHYGLENYHPEATLASLFNKVWYESNTQPEHTWQSTGGSDDSESKLGLVPLISGTLKGSFYTLLFSVPIAVLAALYASQFMKPRWKNVIKPAIEIMAGLPSVVLGFIAALWLAPNIDHVLPGVLITPLVLPSLIIASVFLWRSLPMRLRSIIKPGRELLALIPVIGLGIWLSLSLSHLIESGLLGGDYHSWLVERLGLGYDQRNSLVVSFAMGFAVIPIIFTIAEDAFANVPRHLVLAGRSLGATTWQTAVRVVLPTASPGIFSAIMIGLGRAVGETMIVLMATGNTPITSWNIFNGFRALSANIAVELPEAPVGGTLYRVLFLTALLLFALTFIVNTAAEVVRLRLRKRYSAL